jgi:hypothetical protein
MKAYLVPGSTYLDGPAYVYPGLCSAQYSGFEGPGWGRATGGRGQDDSTVRGAHASGAKPPAQSITHAASGTYGAGCTGAALASKYAAGVRHSTSTKEGGGWG